LNNIWIIINREKLNTEDHSCKVSRTQLKYKLLGYIVTNTFFEDLRDCGALNITFKQLQRLNSVTSYIVESILNIDQGSNYPNYLSIFKRGNSEVFILTHTFNNARTEFITWQILFPIQVFHVYLRFTGCMPGSPK